jgi:ribonuclease HI
MLKQGTLLLRSYAYACTKCRCYLLSSHCTVSGQADVIKYMLHNPIMSGRIGKWAYALIEYDLAYEPLKYMKGQVVADFIVEHWINDTHKLDMSYLTITPWTLYFDGSVCNEGQGIGIVLVSPSDVSFDFSSRLKTYCTNNQAEYEALLFGLELLNCMGVKHVKAFGDSQLVVQQVLEEYQCFDGTLNSYLEKCWSIIHSFDEFSIRHISRVENHRANNLAQVASGYRKKRERFHNIENLITGAGPISQVADRPREDAGPSGVTRRVLLIDLADDEADTSDWRTPIANYLRNPNIRTDKNIRRTTFKYVLMSDELYRRTVDDVLLKCLGPDDAILAIAEVHEGICGTHQSAPKMKWLLRRSGFYWPNMIADCFKYYKGCQVCQKFGDLQLVPVAELHPIIKPWPFRGWGLDFIGEIHPSSSKGHRFVLVTTDYFTKWTKVVALNNMTHKEVIVFITEHIIHRFGIPQTLTIDQGTSFMSKEVREFAELYRIKLLNSSPYYAQANGQAESSNRTLINLIKKKISDNPKHWHKILSEALWAHKISKHSATKVSPFELVYGQEAVLPMEISLNAVRFARQNDLTIADYYGSMMDNIDEVTDKRVIALEAIEKDKIMVARAYNEKVKAKSFQVGDLVWKTILPLRNKDRKFGKWSPSWDGPYKVKHAMSGNTYLLQTLQGKDLPKALNGRFLKQYHPSMWQDV